MTGRTLKTRHAQNLVDAMIEHDACNMHPDDLLLWTRARASEATAEIIAELRKRNLLKDPTNAF